MAYQTLGYGAAFSWNSQTVANLTKIGGIELKIDPVEATTHQSANRAKEFLAGLVDGGDVPLEGYFDYTDSTGQLAMLADAAAGTIRAATITLPAATGGAWDFNGFVTNIKPADNPVDGVIPFSATIKVTGVPEFTVATSAGLTTPFFELNNSAVISPAASGSVYEYGATVLTGVTSVTVTPTASAGVITITANGVSQTVTSGVASSAIALGAAGSVTLIVVKVKETNKAPKSYNIRVVRPGA